MAASSSAKPDTRSIFNGFARVGLSGFGGVLPWVRRTVVEEKRWLSPDEFNGMLGLCQIVPGPSILSLAVCVGYRLAGWRGSVAAFSGLVLGPLILVLLIASLYARAIELPIVAGIMRGISAVGIGLLLATGIKMLKEGSRQPVLFWIILPLFGLLVVGHWRLHEAIAIALPASAALAAWRLRQARTGETPQTSCDSGGSDATGRKASQPVRSDNDKP